MSDDHSLYNAGIRFSHATCQLFTYYTEGIVTESILPTDHYRDQLEVSQEWAVPKTGSC